MRKAYILSILNTVIGGVYFIGVYVNRDLAIMHVGAYAGQITMQVVPLLGNPGIYEESENAEKSHGKDGEI